MYKEEKSSTGKKKLAANPVGKYPLAALEAFQNSYSLFHSCEDDPRSLRQNWLHLVDLCDTKLASLG
ncbi:hypothetical protein TNCV_3694761 [Trichonephila clavipes]|nr:hypothetical protein TNCV_3694761 [Trichonephila clavipes]